MTKAIAGLFSLLAAALASNVAAMPITFYFAGQVASVDSALTSLYGIGDRFSGSYTFESTLSDLDPSQDFGAYVGLVPFSLEIADRTYGTVGTIGFISVRDGAEGFDAYEAGGTGVSGPTVMPYFPSIWRFELEDATANAFTSDALPLAPFPLSAFSFRNFELGFQSSAIAGSQFAWVAGPVTYWAVTPVPEPSSAALLAGGLAVMYLLVRRRINRGRFAE